MSLKLQEEVKFEKTFFVIFFDRIFVYVSSTFFQDLGLEFL